MVALFAYSDEELATQVQQGSKQAFTILVQRHSRRFYGFAYRLLQQQADAEEITQEAFLRFWQKSHLWKPDKGGAFTTWFSQIVLNLCRDYKRRHKIAFFSVEECNVENHETGLASPEQQTIAAAQSKMIAAAIRQLPSRQQEAILLCYYEAYSQKQAAAILEISVKALEALLSRAKKTLQKVMEQQQ